MEEMKINAREFCVRHGGELINNTDGDEIYDIKENGIGLVYMGNATYRILAKDDRNISSHILVEGVKRLTDAFVITNAKYCGCCRMAPIFKSKS